MYNITDHQKKQIEVINNIEKQIKNNNLQFSTVAPTSNYENDPRLCLTSIHLPHQNLLEQINQQIINPLKKIDASHYYYPTDSLHMTIKNIRVINDPPNFNNDDIIKVEKIFSTVIPRHKKFKTYFYRLLSLPNNLALIGTTDPELDRIHLDLDEKLKKINVVDDKKYSNNHYFFCNMTLVRYTTTLTNEFKNKINELSNSILFAPYTVDSVTLLTGNAVLKKKNIIDSWML